VAPPGEKYAAVVGLVEMELESDDPRARAARRARARLTPPGALA